MCVRVVMLLILKRNTKLKYDELPLMPNTPQNTEYYFIYSDDAYFNLPKNKQNNRNWSDSRPFDYIEIPMHDKKILI